MQRLTDDELVERYRTTRNPEYFEEIFRRHRGRIYTQCCLMLRDAARAEEIAQDVFIRAFRGIDTYEPGSLPAWLLQIARRLCINEIRSRASEAKGVQAAAGEAGEPLFTTGPGASIDWLLSEIGAVLRQLKPEHSQALKLRYFDGYSYDQMAALLSVDTETVRTRLQRARINFRKLWEDRGNRERHG